MLVCTHFQKTSVVVERDGVVQGFVSGYRNPERPDTLFIWQVAVDASLRGRGVASEMLAALLSRETLRDVRYIETTIGPSNAASQKLFKRLADGLNAVVAVSPCFAKTLFGGEAHEDEELYRIGPFNHTLDKENL